MDSQDRKSETPEPGVTVRLIEWLIVRIEALPEFWRPVGYGAGLLLILMGARGAALIIPAAIIYILFTSSTPLADIAKYFLIFLLAIAGGGASGLAYSLIGRRLKDVTAVGKYIAGIVTIAPYMFVIAYIVGITDTHASRMTIVEGSILASFMSIVFGSALGHTMFGSGS